MKSQRHCFTEKCLDTITLQKSERGSPIFGHIRKKTGKFDSWANLWKEK